jgi:ketosteroid isomerase-like protein
MGIIDDTAAFVRRYVDVWNEPDADARRSTVTALWAEDGIEHTDANTYRGHTEITARVKGAYEQFVRDGGFRFTLGDEPAWHDGAVTFTVHMVKTSGGGPVWAATILTVLDTGGRIRADHQFARAAPSNADTRATAEELLRRIGAGNPDEVAGLFAEKVDWRLSWPAEGHPAVPWIRPRSTRADVADHFSELRDAHLPQHEVPDPTVLVDGADAVVLTEIRQTPRATGVPYTALCALRLTIEDGLITAYHVYEDSLSVANALAASGVQPVKTALCPPV